MKNFETKNDIKARILKEAAREWQHKGRTDIDLNAFDPIVDLLIGACSNELEKLAHDVANSRNRIFERLVEILTPDLMTSAQPAHTIIHALPTENTYITHTFDQLFYKNTALKMDIFFAPLKRFKLHQLNVEMMAYDNRIVKVNQRFGKDLILESSYGHYIHGSVCYLGVKVNPAIRSLKDVSFFFDWKNEVRVSQFLKSIPLSKWSINGEELKMKSGIYSKEEIITGENADIFAKIGLDNYIEKSIMNLVEPHFITIESDDIPVFENLQLYPQEFKEYFLDEELARLQEPLLWIKVAFPQTLHEHIRHMDCMTNCIPVINRKIHEKQEKVQDNVHIIPVDAEGAHFLGIEELTNSQGTEYREMPLKIIDEADHGIYALRSRGVRRFDNREASHMINYVMDLVKDESAAYNSLSYGNLSSDIEEMETIFRRLKKNITHSLNHVENTSFLFIRPFPSDNHIYMKYWTTDGDIANRIPYGTPLKLFSNANLQGNSISLVTGSRGGRDQLQAVDSIHAFKEAILTRGKVVTAEDMRNFCTNALGFRNIMKMEIKKGVMVDQDPKRGLVRTIDIHITRKMNPVISAEDWITLCHDTEMKLMYSSSSIHPIRIVSHDQQPAYV